MDDLHILIPSHNRQHLFYDIDTRFKDADVKVTIIDSTLNKFNQSLKNCLVIHEPENNFSNKILIALEKIQEKNIILLADDDHLVYENCYELYDSHSKKNSLLTVGNILSSKGYDHNKIYNIKKAPLELNSSDQQNIFLNFYQILWSLYSKDHLKKVLYVIDRCKFKNHNYIELTIAIMTIYESKINFVDKDYLIRSTDKKSWGNKHQSIDIYESIASVEDLTNLIKYSNIDSAYVLKCILLYISSHVTKKQYLRFIKKYLPYTLIYYFKRLKYVITKL